MSAASASGVRLLCLSRYGRLGASSRLRTLQFIPYLRNAGIEVTVHSLFNDEYLSDLYKGRRNWSNVVQGYLRHAWAILGKRRFDVLLVEKEVFPWIPEIVDRLALGITPYIIDIDDAVFHNYDRHARHVVRYLLGSKIDALMRNAAAVTAGNQYLGERARHAGARNIHYLPTVVDVARYGRSPPHPGGTPIIGWIGSPATQDYIRPMGDAIARACRRSNARLVLVGASADFSPGIECDIWQWSEETEASMISRFDVGIMPLPDSPWERGKCGYKLIQYMACAKPVVASRIGANITVVNHGCGGILVDSQSDWEDALALLLESPLLSAQMGEAGYQRAVREFSLEAVAPRLLDIILDVARRTGDSPPVPVKVGS